MDFFKRFRKTPCLGPLPSGWEEVTIDGKTMYINETRNLVQATRPPCPPDKDALPHGWTQHHDKFQNPYYVGICGSGRKCRQDDRPRGTWDEKNSMLVYYPKTEWQSLDWESFSSDKKGPNGKPIMYYRHKRTNEITDALPLASDEHIVQIQRKLDQQTPEQMQADITAAYIEDMRMRHGGFKSRRKQSKRKQSKRYLK